MVASYISEVMHNTLRVKEGKDVVIHFFCSNRYENRMNALAILRGLLYQLIMRKEHLEVYCKDNLRDHNYA